MIHFPKRTPSYIYLRNGTYYFQLRLKKNDPRHSDFKSGLIRKSLKTGICRDAVCKARLMWVEYMVKGRSPTLSDDKIEKSAAYHADLYSRGKQLYKIFSQLDEDDENIKEDFFATAFGSDGYSDAFDREAFVYYTDKQAEKKKNNSSSTNISDPAINDLIANFADRDKIAKNEKTNVNLSQPRISLRLIRRLQMTAQQMITRRCSKNVA